MLGIIDGFQRAKIWLGNLRLFRKHDLGITGKPPVISDVQGDIQIVIDIFK